MSQKRTFKLEYDGVKRRFCMTSPSLLDLRCKIQCLHKCDDQFELKYKDLDGDWLNLDTEEEMEAMLDHMSERIIYLIAEPTIPEATAVSPNKFRLTCADLEDDTDTDSISCAELLQPLILHEDEKSDTSPTSCPLSPKPTTDTPASQIASQMISSSNPLYLLGQLFHMMAPTYSAEGISGSEWIVESLVQCVTRAVLQPSTCEFDIRRVIDVLFRHQESIIPLVCDPDVCFVISDYSREFAKRHRESDSEALAYLVQSLMKDLDHCIPTQVIQELDQCRTWSLFSSQVSEATSVTESHPADEFGPPRVQPIEYESFVSDVSDEVTATSGPTSVFDPPQEPLFPCHTQEVPEPSRRSTFFRLFENQPSVWGAPTRPSVFDPPVAPQWTSTTEWPVVPTATVPHRAPSPPPRDVPVSDGGMSRVRFEGIEVARVTNQPTAPPQHSSAPVSPLGPITDDELLLLRELADMGFGNVLLNRRLLREHSRDVSAVANALLDSE